MRAFRLFIILVVALGAASCKRSAEQDANAPLRLGFFPNVTHAQALVGNAEGLFKAQPGVGALEVKQFNAGPAAMEALVGGSLDVSYVGTGPAINTYLKGGRELRIIAGAVDGGAVLVTRTVREPSLLKGKKLASPQLGNTQDIALRHWLKQQGLSIATDKGGDVQVVPLSNPDILAQYLQGELEGAWVPEPWGARMLAEGGGQILVDERSLWPAGHFPTTVLVTTRKVLETKGPRIEALLRAHVALTERWKADPDAFAEEVNKAFGQLTGKPLTPEVLKDAFSRLAPDVDVDPLALATAAQHAQELGFIPSADIKGMVDTRLLSQVRAAAK